MPAIPTFKITRKPQLPLWLHRKIGDCQASLKRHGSSSCQSKATTTRRIQAAPGIWVRVKLCSLHQIMWDAAQSWTGPVVIREPITVNSLRFLLQDLEALETSGTSHEI